MRGRNTGEILYRSHITYQNTNKAEHIVSNIILPISSRYIRRGFSFVYLTTNL